VDLTAGQAWYGRYRQGLMRPQCLDDGYVCITNPQCCSGFCTDLTCGPCKEEGSWCFYNSDCCLGWCIYYICDGN
ncbi:unnamed protein product, partial [Allacma fusca]